ncbi:MAG: hypothetical protein AAFV71_12385 [Cyanobacteria bacterium J06633_8]
MHSDSYLAPFCTIINTVILLKRRKKEEGRRKKEEGWNWDGDLNPNPIRSP